jgi:hypothetical protein
VAIHPLPPLFLPFNRKSRVYIQRSINSRITKRRYQYRAYGRLDILVNEWRRLGIDADDCDRGKKVFKYHWVVAIPVTVLRFVLWVLAESSPWKAWRMKIHTQCSAGIEIRKITAQRHETRINDRTAMIYNNVIS